jgi:putative restriction endonuclease
MDEEALRTEAFAWLRVQDARFQGELPWEVLTTGFTTAAGIHITFAGQKGIWKPRCFERIPLAIRTTFEGPYDDEPREDGLLRYRYRKEGPDHPDNLGLREAYRTRTPLIYLVAIRRGVYQAVWPVIIVRDNPDDRSCDVLVEPSYILGAIDQSTVDFDELQGESALSIRKYVSRKTLQRIHQTAFRSRVVAAYQNQCTLCRLKHRELLDAAHIIADKEALGDPVVPNGLCLCKIHHAAFDANLIGVSEHYRVKVRPSVLEESDGPMLQHGLKGLEGAGIEVPHRPQDRPDRERLSIRFRQFLEAAS